MPSRRTYHLWLLLLAVAVSKSVVAGKSNCPSVAGCATNSLLQNSAQQSRLSFVTERAGLVQSADSVFELAKADGIAAQTRLISHLSREQNMQAQYLEQLARQQVSVGQKEKAYLDRLEKTLAYQESAIDALSKIALVSVGTTESGLPTHAAEQNAEGTQYLKEEMTQEPAAQEPASIPIPAAEHWPSEQQAPQGADLEDVTEAASAPVAALQHNTVPKKQAADRISFSDLLTLRWSIR